MSGFAHWLYAFLFSPEGGGWGYPYLGLPAVNTYIAIAITAPVAVIVFAVAARRISTHEGPTLAALTAFGFVTQLALRALGPTRLGAVIESPGAMGFLDVARTYGAAEFLTRFHEVVGALPMHVRANLPGKTLFFHLLLAITNSPTVMALLILLISTAGGLMVYFLAREWFGDRRTALMALAFYMYLPAHVYFLPVLNVITPLFLLAPMCLLELHFTSRRMWPLVATGVAVFLMILFEPLPLAGGLVMVGQIIRRFQRAEIGWPEIARVVSLPAAGLVAAYAATRVAFGFDAIDAFGVALDDAQHFNAANVRPYWLWAGHNIKDFLLNMGVGQSALFVFALVAAGRERSWLAVSIAAILFTLTLLGINRGETMRLWIFLGVLMQIAAAAMCERHPRWFPIVLVVSIVQTAVTISSVGFITIN